MKHRITILGGVLFAAAASFGALSLMFGITSVIGSSRLAFQAALAGATAAYLLLLARRSRPQPGKLVLLALSASGLLIGGLVLPLPLYVLLLVGLIWLVRSLLSYHSIVSAGLDGLLCGFGLAFSLWAMLASGSVVLAIWCFFLSQSFAALIPRGIAGLGKERAVRASSGSKDRFQRASKAAEQALRQLAGAGSS